MDSAGLRWVLFMLGEGVDIAWLAVEAPEGRSRVGFSLCEAAEGARVEAPRGVVYGEGVSLPIRLGGMGERRKLPQQGLGQSPSRNRFWCILPLKSDLWCQQFP